MDTHQKSPAASAHQSHSEMSRDIPVALIDAGQYRVRIHIPPNVDDLADSIRQFGLLEPIGVVADGPRYQLIYGERRLIAIKKLGWTAVPAKVLANPKNAIIITLTENIQREQLNLLEEARAYRRMLETGMTQAKLGKLIGKTQSYIAQKLRLEKLPYSVFVLVDLGYYTEGHLRQLLRLEKIVKDCGRSEPNPDIACIYEAMFEQTRLAIAEGRPNSGVINMTTHYQDKMAWHHAEVTVRELKELIDMRELYWRDPDAYDELMARREESESEDDDMTIPERHPEPCTDEQISSLADQLKNLDPSLVDKLDLPADDLRRLKEEFARRAVQEPT